MPRARSTRSNLPSARNIWLIDAAPRFDLCGLSAPHNALKLKKLKVPAEQGERESLRDCCGERFPGTRGMAIVYPRKTYR